MDLKGKVRGERGEGKELCDSRSPLFPTAASETGGFPAYILPLTYSPPLLLLMPSITYKYPEILSMYQMYSFEMFVDLHGRMKVQVSGKRKAIVRRFVTKNSQSVPTPSLAPLNYFRLYRRTFKHENHPAQSAYISSQYPEYTLSPFP